MSPRRRESRHDSRVRLEAKRLAAKGWNVRADLPGYQQPAPIGNDGRIPDIEADKAGAKRLIEVETKESLARDADQHSTFRRSAGQRPRTMFQVIRTDDK